MHQRFDQVPQRIGIQILIGEEASHFVVAHPSVGHHRKTIERPVAVVYEKALKR